MPDYKCDLSLHSRICPWRVTDSPDRGERKRHGRFFLSRARDRWEVRDSVRTALPLLEGRLIDNQDARKLFGGEPAPDNERHFGFRRPATQSGRDHALEFQSRSNARRTSESDICAGSLYDESFSNSVYCRARSMRAVFHSSRYLSFIESTAAWKLSMR